MTSSNSNIDKGILKELLRFNSDRGNSAKEIAISI